VNRKTNILVSNDDGIEAEGLHRLAAELKKFANVYVSAPHRQQSSVGHSISIYYSLRAFQYKKDNKLFGWAVEGTPADAVKLGVLFLYKHIKFDLVVSGINNGANSALAIIYSGTVSAATEGTVLKIPSVALSLVSSNKNDFSSTAKLSAKIIKQLVTNNKKNLSSSTLLNINFPPVPKNKIKGIKITKQGKSNWSDHYEVRSDPNGREYYWLKGKMNVLDKENDTDVIALKQNYISITPLHYDLTDYNKLEEVQQWKLNV
jgi:5'-nucleotidase